MGSGAPRGPRKYDPEKHCGAPRTKHGGAPCKMVKGYGVPGSLGVGNCKHHGGAAHMAALKHGLYSTVKAKRLAHLIQNVQESEADVMDLEPEAHLLRALTVDFLNRFEEMTEALVMWHRVSRPKVRALIAEASREDADIVQIRVLAEDLQGEFAKRPRSVPDIAHAARLVDSIGRTVERIQKIRQGASITPDQLNFILNAQTMILGKHIEPEKLKKVLKDYERIRW